MLMRIAVVLTFVLSFNVQFAVAAESAEDLKLNFVNSFLKVDEDGINTAYETLKRNYPDDPELPCFAYELGRLYAVAASFNSSKMGEWGEKAESFLRQFEFDGPFASDPVAEWAQLEHIRHLLATKQESAASILSRDMANTCSDEVFLLVLKEVMSRIVVNKPDVEYWRLAGEKRILKSENPSEDLVFQVALLQDWGSEETELQMLVQRGQSTQSLAQAAWNIDSNDTRKYFKETKRNLDEFFERSATEGYPVSLKPESIAILKLHLSQAELWSSNRKRSWELLKEIMRDRSSLSPQFMYRVRFKEIIARNDLGLISDEERDNECIALLNEGYSSAVVVRFLAQWAEQRGSAVDAYAYYEALGNGNPNPARVLWVRERQELLRQKHPAIEWHVQPIPGLNLRFDEEQWLVTEEQMSRAYEKDLRGPRRFPAWREPLYKVGDFESRFALTEP